MSRAQIDAAGSGTIHVSGELTFSTVTALNGHAEKLFASQSGDLTIDLGGVNRADSAGLALLIEWLRWARQHGVALRFRHMPTQMRTIAAVSDLDPILSVCD
jgi:phospholipid transport system transporter-binding protein